MAYSSKKGTAFVDRALYVPKEWTEEPAHCAEAGIPQTVGSLPQDRAGKEGMLERAFQAGSPRKWVVADSFHGGSHGFGHWLEKRGRPYAVIMLRRPTPSVTEDVERRSTN